MAGATNQTTRIGLDKMKIYIASTMHRQEEMRALIRPILEGRGHIVTSRWIDGEEESTDLGKWREWARMDIQDIRSADMILIFAGKESSAGGYHVELGYSLAAGKEIIVLERRPNIFYASLIFYETLDELIKSEIL